MVAAHLHYHYTTFMLNWKLLFYLKQVHSQHITRLCLYLISVRTDASLESVMQAHLTSSTRASLPNDGGPLWELTAPSNAIAAASAACAEAARVSSRDGVRQRATVWALVDALWGQPVVDADSRTAAVCCCLVLVCWKAKLNCVCFSFFLCNVNRVVLVNNVEENWNSMLGYNMKLVLIARNNHRQKIHPIQHQQHQKRNWFFILVQHILTTNHNNNTNRIVMSI